MENNMTYQTKYHNSALKLLNKQVFIERHLTQEQFVVMVNTSGSERELIKQLLHKAPIETGRRIVDIIECFDWEFGE